MFVCFFFFKQKTAYEMRISDWSSDVCSSDLARRHAELVDGRQQQAIAGGPAVEVQNRGASDLGIGHAAAGREEPVVAELVLATGTPRRAQDSQLALTGPDVAGAHERTPHHNHDSEAQRPRGQHMYHSNRRN